MPAPLDPYVGHADLTSQGESWADVTPSNTAVFTTLPKALWINVAGDIALEGANGNAVTFTVPIGLMTVRPFKVLATGTTATGIKAIY